MYSSHFKLGLESSNSPSKELDPNKQILVTNGACEGLFSATHNLIDKGDEVLAFQPYYTQYVNYVEFAGGKLKTIPMRLDSKNVWEFDFDQFESMINERTKVVFLNNPHNPTGKVFTEKEIERLTNILNKHP